MAATTPTALTAELDGVFDNRSPERRAHILHQMTRLFLTESDRLNDELIVIFDEVLLRLMEQADTQVLAVLSNNLCSVSAAPRRTIRQLAFHYDVLVAGPILRRSMALPDKDLLEIVDTRGPEHLLEICGRQTVSMPLGDKLVERGEIAALRRLIQNLGVRFSDEGCTALVAKAKQDDLLAEALVRRSDVLPELRKELVAKVNEARTRVKQAAPSAMQEKIKAAIATTAERTEMPTSGEYSAAHSKMVELSRKGGLNDRSVNRFAVEHDYVNVAAALSVLSVTPVEVIAPLIASDQLDGLMVACKAARLNWATTKMIIGHRPGCKATTAQELEQAKAAFDVLSLSVAQRTIRLW
jgi:uncharacterized protein (DUF2336 family)